MRNFSTSVQSESFIAICVDENMTGEPYQGCLRALLIALEATAGELTASERCVMNDFHEWFRAAQEDDRNGHFPRTPSFVYVNVSTGFVLVFIATDSKGKIAAKMP